MHLNHNLNPHYDYPSHEFYVVCHRHCTVGERRNIYYGPFATVQIAFDYLDHIRINNGGCPNQHTVTPTIAPGYHPVGIDWNPQEGTQSDR